MQRLTRLCAGLLLLVMIGSTVSAQDDTTPLDTDPADCQPDVDYMQMGAEARDEGDMRLAVYHFSCAIKVDPENSAPWFSRGYVLGQLDEHEAAIEDYTRSIEIDPNEPTVYNNRAWEYELIGEMALSAADYLQHILVRRPVREDWFAFYGYPESITLNGNTYYRIWFDARAGDIIDLTVTSQDGAIDPLIVLTDQDDVPLAANDDRAPEVEDLNSAIYGYVIEETGSYTLYVTQWSGDENTGELDILIEAGVSY